MKPTPFSSLTTIKKHKLHKNSIISQSPEDMNHGICSQKDLLYCAEGGFMARKVLNASHCVLLYHLMVVLSSV